MTATAALYVCLPCRSQQFHDVTAGEKAPKRACTACGGIMIRTLPSLAPALIRKFHAPTLPSPLAVMQSGE